MTQGSGDVGSSGGADRDEPSDSRQRTHDMHKNNCERGGRYDDRDPGRDRYNDRDRGYDNRDRGRDRYDDRDRGYDRDRDMNRGYNRGEFDNNRSSRDQSRHGRGLGFDDNRSRGRDDREWDRDRGNNGGGIMGRGRGRSSTEMNFVRSERDRDDFGRDNNINNMDRGMDSSSLSSGMGRGRGRGRGGSINQPAWMTSGSSGPVGIQGDSSSSKNAETDENLEKLLAQAKQLQQEQTKRDDNQRRSGSSANNSSSQRGNNTSNNSSRNDNNKQTKCSSTRDDEAKLAELQKQRQLEAEEAAKKAEEERKRIEREREEEEQRQLRALVGDISDDDENMKDGNSKKRKDDENDGEEDLFEFETEEEREERLANKRREERKKKMRKLEESAPKTVVKKDEDDMKVDQPRNVSGVIQSQLNAADDLTNTGATNMEVEESNQVKEEGDNGSGTDSFDIFGTDNAIPETQTSKNAIKNKSAHSNAQECDDAEGYYKSNIGEIITLPKERRADMYDDEDDAEDRTSQFRVLGIIGKGVFSSVIKCVEETNTGNTNTNNEAGGRVIAMKIIRNNEIMARAAAKEMRVLRMLCHQKPRTSKKKHKKDKEGVVDNEVDDEDDEEERVRRERENHNIVRLLDVDPTMSSSSSKDTHHYAAPPPEFRRHCIFLFEFLPFNLREVLSKFGKNVGINLTAVRSYGRQLLCALAHLERHRVVHADLKPDNILVSANFSTVKLADFGSAFFETDHDNDPTPYLVSRFYRPPEVILGLEYNRMVDLWSLSVTLAELFTGTVLFPGKSNNDMLVRFMDAMGPFSHKMVKRHALSYTKMGLQPHFEVGTGGTYQLRKQDVDRVTGQPVCRLETVLTAKPESRLASVLLKASKGVGAPGERVELLKFADFLNRCLALDPAKRLSVRDALKHDHQQRTKKKVANIPTEIK